MLAVQEQKLALDMKQAEIALREIDHNQKIADKSIQAQVEDRRDDRAVGMRMGMHRLVFVAVIVTLLVSFALVALYFNKEAIVLDLVKLLVGFVGGWGASKIKIPQAARKHRESDDTD